MDERGAILLAGTAHLALLAALSLSWAMTEKTLPSFEEMAPVEVVDIADVPKVTEAPKPSMEVAPQETVEDAAPEPDPEPQPAPPEPQAMSDVPPPEAKPVETPKPPKAEVIKPATRKLDAQLLSSLLDKTLPKAAKKPLDTSKFADTIEKALPKGAKLDARAAATLKQAILSQLSPCWSPPMGGGDDVKDIVVIISVQFERDGRVKGRPEAVRVERVPPGREAYVRAFKDAAIRTVLNPRCVPLKLPANLYDAVDGWRSVEIGISASTMT